MKSTSSVVVGILLVIVIFATGLVLGARGMFAYQLDDWGLLHGAAPVVSSEQPADVDLRPVWRAWNILDTHFIDAYATSTTAVATSTEAQQERVWGLISGLADSLGDPYTVFLPPSDSERFHDDISGSFEGVGMEISIRDRILTVVSPLKGTPASKAGIESGDRILEIDGVSTQDMDIDAAVNLIRGPRGTDVVFTVAREGVGETLEISVTRDVIQIPTIETSVHEAGPFIIELLNFSAKSPELFRQALQEFADSGASELIIDLRGNPGGFLDAAVDMASWFLPSGKIVVTEDYGDSDESVAHRSRGYDVFTDELKLVILVDRGSASASEILAGALREHGKATLIGTNTFGKGSVQELLPVTSDTSIKVTVARWLLAGDVFISRDGIEPDILVELPENEEDEEEDRDYIMDAAIEYLRTQ